MWRTFLFSFQILLLLICSFFLYGSTGIAAPKTVAILNLSEQEEGQIKAKEVRELLNMLPDLLPTNPGNLARSLEASLPSGGLDGSAIVGATTSIQKASKAFEEFRTRLARKELEKARQVLKAIGPRSDTTKLLAKISFQFALLHLREQNLGLALGELQLFHRLVSRDDIDPIRYPPDVIQAFHQAKKLNDSSRKTMLSVSSTYDGAPVYIDGIKVGICPLQIEIPSGPHLLSIAAPKYQAQGLRLDLPPETNNVFRIDLKPRSPVRYAHAIRMEATLKGLREKDLRWAASAVSRLVGSDSVLVLTGKPGNSIQAALYIQTLDKMSYQHIVNQDLKYLFELILEGATPSILEEGKQPTIHLPWYRKPWAVATIGAGAAITLVSLLTLSFGEDQVAERTGIVDWTDL